VRLLVIEDNEALAANLQEIFELEGYHVRVAHTAAAGLEEAAHGFDIALLDVRLPDAAGTSIVPDLRACDPACEVVIATANADVSSAIAAVQGGAFAYLTKPVRTEELLLTVERAREKIELRRRSVLLQEALESSERRLRALVENVQAVIVTVGPDRRIRFVSRGVTEILGYGPAELLGEDIVDALATPKSREACVRMLRDAPGEANVHEVDCVHKDGGARRMVWRWTGVRPRADGVLYGVGTDISERRALERRARMAEKLALAGTLTAGLAHEIRNPLNAATLQLTVLSRMLRKAPEALRPSLDGPIELVQSELRRLDVLLQDFLSFARPREYVFSPVDPAAVVRHVAALLGEAAAAVGKELRIDALESAEIRADRDALEQVILNLAKNAIDAARHRVVIRMSADEGQVCIEVGDDGVGIPAEVLDRIFEPFFTTKPSGTGLGMAIAHTIVDAHDGAVEVDTSEGEGTTFRVRLPISP
jgi:PAS domain S-box-containing protein